MKKLTKEELEKKYISGEVKQFDQKNDMYKRLRWQPEWRDAYRALWLEAPPRDVPGYTQLERAFENGGWYIESAYAQGTSHENFGLFEWEEKPWYQYHRLPESLKYKDKDPKEMARIVKKVAKKYGVDLVGICKIDPRWIYSASFNMGTREHKPMELPENIKYAIVFAVEMDYDMVKTSPASITGAAAGVGYSRMAYTAALLAGFIRSLGYKAIPSGNDTAIDVPMAVDAGLGELGRHGVLITKKYGPRVRLAKVMTDLELATDSPVEFGVTKFCDACATCAKYCPGQAISYDKRTPDPVNISTSPGVLKWPVDAEKCLQGWLKQKVSCCGNCLRVCPFNKEEGWLHDLVRWGIEHTPFLNKFFVWADGALGYHKQLTPEKFWAKEDKE